MPRPARVDQTAGVLVPGHRRYLARKGVRQTCGRVERLSSVGGLYEPRTVPLGQACALAVTAYDIGSAYESERVRLAVRDFRAGLGGTAPARLTAELDDRLHTAYTTRAT